MSLRSTLEGFQPDFDWNKYANPTCRPALDQSKIVFESLVGDQREHVRTPCGWDASFLLRYKRREGAITSLEEINDGVVWNIPQVQGAKSKKSYRLTKGLNWQHVFADAVAQCVQRSDNGLEHVTMPRIEAVEGVTNACGNPDSSYTVVRKFLNMRWSDELGFYVVDASELRK